MGLSTKITWRGSPEQTLVEFRRSLKPELEYIGLFWYRSYLPKHFGRGAAGRYGYQARGVGYSREKTRRTGQGGPLEFWGSLRDMVERMARVSSTGKSVSVRMTGPRYLYPYRKDYDQPDKAAELTATNQEERDFMDRLLERRVTRRLNAVHTTEIVSN